MKVKVRRTPVRNRSTSYVGVGIVSVLLTLGIVFISTRGVAMNDAGSRQADASKELLVPVPAHTVAQGQSLSKVEFVYVKWTDGPQVASFVRDLAPYRDHIAAKRLSAYMPITVSSLNLAGADLNAVVERIPEGMRAITVKVDAESAVEGWAQSGSFVDVIVMRRLKEGDNSIETKVIAENVKILSAGRSTKSTPDMPKPPATITLLVDQADALRIKTATHLGKITFSLRGLGDETPTVLTQMNQRALLGSSSIQLPREKPFRGRATGPNGDEWVLSDSNRWHKQKPIEPVSNGE